MIYDSGTEVSLSVPSAGDPFAYSAGIDLAPNDGDPALFGTGERLYMQFEVTTAFVASNAGVVNFGVAIDDNATLTATSHILALTGGSITNTDFCGFVAADLTVGRLVHLAIPAWEDILQAMAHTTEWPVRKNAGDLTAFRGMRYMGPVMSIPNSTVSSGGFSAGAIKARIIKDPSGTAALSNIYGSRMTVL